MIANAHLDKRFHGLEEANQVGHLLLEVDDELDTLDEYPLDLGLFNTRKSAKRFESRDWHRHDRVWYGMDIREKHWPWSAGSK